jgi:hypothetical protein
VISVQSQLVGRWNSSHQNNLKNNRIVKSFSVVTLRKTKVKRTYNFPVGWPQVRAVVMVTAITLVMMKKTLQKEVVTMGFARAVDIMIQDSGGGRRRSSPPGFSAQFACHGGMTAAARPELPTTPMG